MILSADRVSLGRWRRPIIILARKSQLSSLVAQSTIPLEEGKIDYTPREASIARPRGICCPSEASSAGVAII